MHGATTRMFTDEPLWPQGDSHNPSNQVFAGLHLRLHVHQDQLDIYGQVPTEKHTVHCIDRH